MILKIRLYIPINRIKDNYCPKSTHAWSVPYLDLEVYDYVRIVDHHYRYTRFNERFNYKYVQFT